MAINTSIATNVSANFARTSINSSANAVNTSISRLSSGDRITKASDDVASLAIGTSIATNVKTLEVALINAGQATSLLQVADGGLAQISTILQRMKTVATQANSGTLTSTERGFLNQEFTQLRDEIDRIAGNTNFNGVILLDGTLGAAGNTATFSATPASVNANGSIGNPAFFNTSYGTNGIDLTAITVGTSTGFIGSITDFEVTHDFDNGPGDNVLITTVINGETFTADLNGTDDLNATDIITFESADDLTSEFTLRVADGVIDYNIDSQADADEFELSLEQAFADLSIRQTRAIDAATYTAGTGVLNGVLAADITLNSAAFDTTANTHGTITSFVVNQVSSAGAQDASISVTIDGELFTATGLGTAGDQIDAATTATFNNTAGDKSFVIDFANVGASIDILTSTQASTLQADLNTAFGISTGTGNGEGLEFQVGTDSTDSISVSISSSTSSALGLAFASVSGADNTNAVVAVSLLDNALDTVTSIRSEVGAVQSRFGFASSNLEVSINNQDAARGELLDTDVSKESTAYATEQVKLQAGIAILAQANLQPQLLLELIG